MKNKYNEDMAFLRFGNAAESAKSIYDKAVVVTSDIPKCRRILKASPNIDSLLKGLSFAMVEPASQNDETNINLED